MPEKKPSSEQEETKETKLDLPTSSIETRKNETSDSDTGGSEVKLESAGTTERTNKEDEYDENGNDYDSEEENRHLTREELKLLKKIHIEAFKKFGPNSRSKNVLRKIKFLESKLDEMHDEVFLEYLEVQKTLLREEVTPESDEEILSKNNEKSKVLRRSVFVNNVHFKVEAEDLKKSFELCGKVSRVTILKNKFGHPRGFAYVEFESARSVKDALKMNGMVVRGREITVMRKRENVPQFRKKKKIYF